MFAIAACTVGVAAGLCQVACAFKQLLPAVSSIADGNEVIIYTYGSPSFFPVRRLPRREAATSAKERQARHTKGKEMHTPRAAAR